MEIYLYAKTGHNLGLEALRRISVIANKLQEQNLDVTVATSDYRASTYANRYLGVHKAVGIDILTNLPNIAHRGDIIIFESDEPSEITKEYMQKFASILYEVGANKDILPVLVDDKFQNSNYAIEKTIFFGDDDYDNWFLDFVNQSKIKQEDISLLMGHYFFLGNEDKFANNFANIIDEEEYEDTIRNSKYLLTASMQSALESIHSGNYPVLFKRANRFYDDSLIQSLNIPVINGQDFDDLIQKFNIITKSYPTLKKLELFDIEDKITNIKQIYLNFNNAIGL